MNEKWLKERTKEELIEMLVNETDATRELLDNWNELKKWLEEESKLKGSETAYLYYGRVLKQMQELEQGKDE